MRAEGRRWILASHHPYADLGRATPPRFNDIRDAGGIPVTLSGHTHSGEIRLNFDEEREDDFLEINVGSMLDSPIEFRDLQVHRIGERLAVSSNRHIMENLLREQGLMADQLPGYRPSPGDPDHYLAYRGEEFEANHDKTDFSVKRVLLAAYLRMFRLFEADDPDQSSTYWPGQGRNRTTDTRIFSPLLYQLSYLAEEAGIRPVSFDSSQAPHAEITPAAAYHRVWTRRAEDENPG